MKDVCIAACTPLDNDTSLILLMHLCATFGLPAKKLRIRVNVFQCDHGGTALMAASCAFSFYTAPSSPRITFIRNRTSTLLQVEWERPTQTNGELAGYYIFWTHERLERSKVINFSSEAEDVDPMTYSIKGLGESSYYLHYGHSLSIDMDNNQCTCFPLVTLQHGRNGAKFS